MLQQNCAYNTAASHKVCQRTVCAPEVDDRSKSGVCNTDSDIYEGKFGSRIIIPSQDEVSIFSWSCVKIEKCSFFSRDISTKISYLWDVNVAISIRFFAKQYFCVSVTVSGLCARDNYCVVCPLCASWSHLRTISCEICVVFKPHRGISVSRLTVCGL